MSEQLQRYERIKELEFEEQREDCPVAIVKGVLLRDTATERSVLQLKFDNRSDREIKAVHVSVLCRNEVGLSVLNLKYAYEGISVGAFDSFGSDQAIDIGDILATNIRVIVEQVEFASKAVWVAKRGIKALWKRSVYLKALIPLFTIGVVGAILVSKTTLSSGYWPFQLLDFLLKLIHLLGLAAGIAVYAAIKRKIDVSNIRQRTAFVVLCIDAGRILLSIIVCTVLLIMDSEVGPFIWIDIFLTIAFIGTSLYVLTQKEKADVKICSIIYLILLCAMAIRIVAVYIFYPTGEWSAMVVLALIKNIITVFYLVTFAVIPNKATQVLQKVFMANNIPAQIGLAALTAFLVNF